MLDMLASHVKDRAILNCLWQAMRRSVTWGGLYKDCERQIKQLFTPLDGMQKPSTQ